MDFAVSVLTPVYNVEPYLRECLDSLAAQTLENIEFVCINDGSTDGSLEILREYEAKDSRFVVIDKPNGGYGTAMNKGLEAARGEYIGILESDDWAEPEMFEKLYIAAKSDDCDLAKCNFYQFNSAFGSFEKENFPEAVCGEVFCPSDPDRIRIVRTVPAIWSAVYRKAFLERNGICFLETPGASFQDTGFVFKSWVAAERAVLIHDYLIHYRVNRPGSSVKSDSKVFNVCAEWASIDAFIRGRSNLSHLTVCELRSQKFETYLWNYNRIKWEHKKDFALAISKEYCAHRAEGELEEKCYTKQRWKRLNLLIENPVEMYQQDADNRMKAHSLKVSVIVPVYNSADHVVRLMDSLDSQTLDDIEIIIVDDGSVDGSAEIIDSYVDKHSKFRVIHQANAGVAAARNTGLFHARGKYVVFADADDIVPKRAYEALYSSIETNKADMAIGKMVEFSGIGKTTYVHTAHQAKMKYISKYDWNFAYSLSVCNKMFRSDLIDERELSFPSYAIGEDAVFLLRYLSACSEIVGCNAVVYQYRKALFVESRSATSTFDTKRMNDYFESLRRVKNVFDEYADADIVKAQEEGRLADARRIVEEKLKFDREIDKRIPSLALDRYYRRVWAMDEQCLPVLNGIFSDGIAALCTEDKMEMFEGSYFSDLRLGVALKGKKELAQNPLVSIILTAETPLNRISTILESLIAQDFPAFEVLLPKMFSGEVPQGVANMENIRYLEADKDVYLESAIRAARSSYINILQDQIMHERRSLIKMWNIAKKSRADFVSFNFAVLGKNKRRKRVRSIRQVFLNKNCVSPSLRLAINDFDCSFNNKIFKKSALLAETDLKGTSYHLMRRFYKTMSFEKVTDISMVSFGTPDSLSAPVSKKAKVGLYVGNVKRYLVSPAFEKKRRYPLEKFASMRMRKRRICNEVLFFTNRNGDVLSANLQLVLDELTGIKTRVFAEPLPHSAEYDKEVRKAIARAKVIVTDDYCSHLKDIKLKPSQTVIQLWHACGAFKKFGLDYPGASISNEKSLHRQYSLVSVSSEFVRSIYANAFGIPKNRVRALGIPRTDLLLDNERLDVAREKMLVMFPQLVGKKTVLYAPTFRQKSGTQIRWDCRIDWSRVSRELPEDVVLIVKRHPLEGNMMVSGEYHNILEVNEIDDFSTVAIADALVTDYSSIVFDFALLDKPFGFYCPDIDEYETDFYLRFPEDFESGYCTDSNKLPVLLEELVCSRDAGNRNEYFRKKFLGACDGHSTERIVKYIKESLKK